MTPTAEARLLGAFAKTALGQARSVIGVRRRRGRCASALLTLAPGGRVFIKQDLGNGRFLLEREAALLARLNACPALADLVPRLLLFDPEAGLLATAGLDGCVPLDRRLQTTSLADCTTAIAAGLALTRLHRQPIAMDSAATHEVPFPLEPLEPLTPLELVQRPAEYALVAAVLEGSRHRIGELAARWRHSHFIHGDFKAGNLLVKADQRRTEGSLMTIVDWEMAGAGDPMWDIGSYIGSVLVAWINAISPQVVRTEVLAGPDANSLRRQVGYFLITYRHLALAHFEITESFTSIALQYAGISLLHRALIGLEIRGFLDQAGSLILELARGFLNHPERAAQALLGGSPV